MLSLSLYSSAFLGFILHLVISKFASTFCRGDFQIQGTKKFFCQSEQILILCFPSEQENIFLVFILHTARHSILDMLMFIKNEDINPYNLLNNNCRHLKKILKKIKVCGPHSSSKLIILLALFFSFFLEQHTKVF